MKHFVYSFIILCVLSACSETKEQEFIEVPALKSSEIYRASDVKKYLMQYGSTHHAFASSYADKAAAAIKSKDYKKAVYFLKRSITLEPALQTYEKLIELLSETKNYSEATDAYKVLVDEAYYEVNGSYVHEYVFDKPTENTITDFVITTVLADNALDYNTLYYVDETMDKQKIRARLIADPRFNYDTSNIAHKNIILQFWTADEIEMYKKSLTNLNALLNSVPDTAAAFEISQKNVNRFRYEDFNGMNYSEMDEGGAILFNDMVVYYLKEKMDNPDAWLQYNVNHAFQPQPGLRAIVYAVDTSTTACPIEMREIYHRLIIYNAEGKMVSDKVIACHSGEVLQTVAFNKDHFEITAFKRSWKKPYDKRDFDNEINKTEEISKKTYSISPTGDIAENVPVQ